MSDCTVVSLVPFFIKEEEKPGLSPGRYLIPQFKDGKLGLLVVRDAQRSVFIDGDRGSMYMSESGENVARSLVDDYSISQPAQGPDAGPGLFWVKGAYTDEKTVRTLFATELEVAREKQRKWFISLVNMADDSYNRNKQLRLISDLARLACRELNLKRDWVADSPDVMTKCPVCTTIISTFAAVCFACHAILKPEEIKKYQFLGGSVQPVSTSGAKA